MLNDLAALYAASSLLFAGSVFVLGLVVGSFLNVVIYRLPIMLEREWRAQAIELLPSADSAATTITSDTGRALQLEHPALRLPGVQGTDQGLAEHPGDQLARAARPLRRLPGAHFRALSAGRARDRPAVRRGGLALRRHGCHRVRAWASPGR